ncbi:MAG: metallophosphoesterase [Planctomycetes bacterium]|nr:metallophosphoesterase [Planctomycetota bacterium]MBI3835707.1 metallophosphoesterase [Planctomycetota bacterium]
MKPYKHWPKFIAIFFFAFTAVVFGAEKNGKKDDKPKEPTVDPAATHAIPQFTVPPATPDVFYLRFLVIGDWGTGRPDQVAVAKAMAQRATVEPPGFILTVGDNFYENGVKDTSDPQWETAFENVYGDPSLAVPFYASLGNHDHKGSIQAQIDYGSVNPRWKLPNAYYNFSNTLPDGTKIDLFAIDTDPLSKKAPGYDVQLGWLNRELQASDAQWKIVFGHHPLWSNGEEHGDDPVLIEMLKPIFEKHKVDVYMAGHEHTLEMLKPVNGVNYFVSGGAAGVDKAYGIKWTDRDEYAATLGGFTAVRMSRHEMVIEFVRLDAKTQYAYVINK